MEILVISIIIGLVYLGTSIYFFRKMKEVYTVEIERTKEALGKAIAQNLVHLKPENRYILSFPFDISDDDFDILVERMQGTLDLENSNTHIVIVQGKVTMIEFD